MKLTVRQSLTIVTLLALAIFLGSVLSSLGELSLDYLREERNVYTTPDLPPYDYNQDFTTNISKRSPMVRLEDKDGKFFCSGTVISNEYVLTAAHCLMDRSRFGAKMRTDSFNVVSQGNLLDKLIITSTAAALAQGADYALVRGDFTEFNKAAIDARSSLITHVEAPVINCGFPYGSKAICYAILAPPQTYVYQWATQGFMFPGMSGGPVVDGRGVVFAVNTAVLQGGVLISPLVGMFEALDVPVLNDEAM